MNRMYFAMAATLALGTAACGNSGTAVGCTAESAQAPVVGIVKDQLERAISAKVRGEDGARSVSLSKISSYSVGARSGFGDVFGGVRRAGPAWCTDPGADTLQSSTSSSGESALPRRAGIPRPPLFASGSETSCADGGVPLRTMRDGVAGSRLLPLGDGTFLS